MLWCFDRTVSELQTADHDLKARCLLTYEGSTGQIFLAVILYIQTRAPSVVLLENVVGLVRSQNHLLVIERIEQEVVVCMQ